MTHKSKWFKPSPGCLNPFVGVDREWHKRGFIDGYTGKCSLEGWRRTKPGVTRQSYSRGYALGKSKRNNSPSAMAALSWGWAAPTETAEFVTLGYPPPLLFGDKYAVGGDKKRGAYLVKIDVEKEYRAYYNRLRDHGKTILVAA